MDEFSFPTSGGGTPRNARGEEGEDPLPLVRALLSISKSTRAFLALLLSDIGLHLGQDQLIACLQHGEPMSVSTLADRIAVRPSTVSKMLDRLVEKGAVRRVVSAQDARRTMVLLTEEGAALKPRVAQVWARLESELSGGMSPDEARAVKDAMARMDLLLATRLRRHR
jgi:MarR family transcriptional regulator, organic hydroperoxide resistance regulator